ncbi:hypothetical protein M1512_01650 [Patescibacteria group bacterium]|nr:hypothetical protein [Patescibacteria group bacterium]
MFGSRQLQFLLGLGVAIALIIVILLIVFIPSGHKKVTTKPMAAYANNPTAQVAMLIDGPTNAPSLHSQVQVYITNSITTINIFRGYNDMVVKSSIFPMDEAAFHVFLRSLEYAGYNDGITNSKLAQASGICPLGDRYIFTFNVNGVQKQRYWQTSCGGLHTYNGNLQLTLSLFQAQVPGYSSIISGTNL